MILRDFINEKRNEYQKNEEQKYVSGIAEILKSQAGIEVFRRILTDTKVFNSCFTGNSTTFYNEGRRDVGLNILADLLKADPDAISKIFKAHSEKSLFEQQLENIWTKEFDDER